MTNFNKINTMKARTITLMLLAAICLSTYAQDDDMYSFSSKKKVQPTNASSSALAGYDASDVEEAYVEADYHTGELRDVDENSMDGGAW